MNPQREIYDSTILVTGGAGFIGSNLVEVLLAQRNRVVCLDNFATGSRRNIAAFEGNASFRLIEGDICDQEVCLEACRGVDYVLHQAALGSVPRSIKDPVRSLDVNVGGFARMLWAAKEAGAKRFVYAASSSVYGDSRELPKREECIGKPLSPYAVSKYADELLAKNFDELYGLETVGLRYFNVFGRRQSPDGAYAAVIPRFAASLIRHESPVIYGDGAVSRDFTYIDNVIQANQLAALAPKEAATQVYNIACGQSSSLNELFAYLREYLSAFDPEIASVEAVHGAPRAGDILHSLADISKARRFLGYDPEYDFRGGLKFASEWYFNNRD